MVILQFTEIGAADMMLTELRCTFRVLEINLDSMRNLKTRLENSLQNIQGCYTVQLEQLNVVLLHLESLLTQTKTEGQHQTQKHEALLNNKLEAEMATYRCLLEDAEDFNLNDSLDSSKSVQTIHRPLPTGWWAEKWCLKSMTPKY
jgi:hypothetical protein